MNNLPLLICLYSPVIALCTAVSSMVPELHDVPAMSHKISDLKYTRRCRIVVKRLEAIWMDLFGRSWLKVPRAVAKAGYSLGIVHCIVNPFMLGLFVICAGSTAACTRSQA